MLDVVPNESEVQSPRTTHLCWKRGNVTFVLAVFIPFSFFFGLCVLSVYSLVFSATERPYVFCSLHIVDDSLFFVLCLPSAGLMARNLEHVVPLHQQRGQTSACCGRLPLDPPTARRLPDTGILSVVSFLYNMVHSSTAGTVAYWALGLSLRTFVCTIWLV